MKLKNFCILLVASLYTLANYADTLFINATLSNLNSGKQTLTQVLVVNQKIAAIGVNLEAPKAEVIDLQGGYLMPGLAEMHAHVPPLGNDAGYLQDVLFLWAANGVTTIRGMLGKPEHLKLRENLHTQTLLGPRLITSGPSLNGNSVKNPEHGASMVREQHALGYNFLKMHPGLTLENFDAIAQQANALKMPFAGHVSLEVGLLHTLNSGQITIDHLDGYLHALVDDEQSLSAQVRSAFFGVALLPHINKDKIRSLVEATVSHKAWVVPTQTFLENYAYAGNPQILSNRHEAQYLPERLLTRYKKNLSARISFTANIEDFLKLRRRIIYALHEGGAKLLLGSDAPQIFNVPGFSLHRELKAMVDAGLTPAQAWITGTTNPAEFMHLETTTGKIESGFDADFIWLKKNPLVDIENSQSIAGVMLRGQWLNSQQIDKGLKKINQKHRRRN